MYTEDLLKENDELRTMLAVAHCGGSHQLYHDDGELQDTRAHPFIDWRRDSIDEIQRKLLERLINSPEGEQLIKDGILRKI